MKEIPQIQNYIPDWIYLVLLIGISLVDIFANSLSVVPVLGTFASVVSESALEGMQILLVILFGGKKFEVF